MRTIFYLRRDPGDNYNLPDLPLVLTEKEAIRKAINLHQIQNYRKVLMFEKDDYVTCCETENSVRPMKLNGGRKGAGFVLGKTFRASSSLLTSRSSYIVIDDNKRAVYAENLRQATDEEIKTFLEREAISKDLDDFINKMFE